MNIYSVFLQKTIDKQKFLLYNIVIRTNVYEVIFMKNNRISKVNKNKGILNKIKMVLFIFIVLVIFTFFTSFQMGKNKLETYDIVIDSSDTIWNIAENICEKNNNLNIQNVVIEIKEINNLSSSDIYVGQTLSLPIY